MDWTHKNVLFDVTKAVGAGCGGRGREELITLITACEQDWEGDCSGSNCVVLLITGAGLLTTELC